MAQGTYAMQPLKRYTYHCECGRRVRETDSNSCPNKECSAGRYRPPSRGTHWVAKRLRTELICLYPVLGIWLDGGHILCLRHRHDIRAACAATLVLKTFNLPLHRRVWIRFHLRTLYWKWGVGAAVSMIASRVRGGLTDDCPDDAWQKVMEGAWEAAQTGVKDRQVVCMLKTKECFLMERRESQKVPNEDCARYHPLMNPSARRTAAEY